MQRPKIPWDVLLGGLAIAASVAVLIELPAVNRLLGGYPDGLGIALAPWLLLAVFWSVLGVGAYRQQGP